MSFCRACVVRKRFLNRSFAFGVLMTSAPFLIYVMFFVPSENPRTSNLFSTNIVGHRLLNATSQRTNATSQRRTEQNNRNNIAKQTQGEIISNSTSFTGLNVHMWFDVCGTDVDILRNWPNFPYFPDKRSYISDFRKIQDNGMKDNGERCFGFIHPHRSGEYKFAITSDDTSELWLSPNEDPASSEMIARVYSPKESAWTKEGDYNKYPDQISREITLHAGKKYYIESLSKQGSGDSHVALYWSYSSSNSTFVIISSKYLSSFSGDHNEGSIPLHAGKQANISPERKNNHASHLKRRLPFVSKEEYIRLIPSCPYSPSFVLPRKVKKYQGFWLTCERVSHVFPPDDTNMFGKVKWSQPNPVIDKNRVESVMDKFLSSLRSR